MNTSFRMFCYRYWLESQTRLIIAFVLMMLVLLQALNGAEDTINNHPQLFGGKQLLFTQYVWVIIYKGYFLTIFVLATFLFGVGSPVQEKASGTAQFSLSLPVKRQLLIYAKLFTASIQVIGLSLVMALMIPLLSGMFGFRYPVLDAFLFSALIAAGGLAFMVLGFMLSLFINSEAVIIPLGIAIMSALFFITKMPALKSLNIFNFMTGAGYLGNENFLFKQPIDLLGIFVIFSGLLMIIVGLVSIFKRMDM